MTIKGTASPSESIKAHIILDKSIQVSGGRYQFFVDDIKVPEDTNHFTVTAHGEQLRS
jgi:hypothetical protein